MFHGHLRSFNDGCDRLLGVDGLQQQEGRLLGVDGALKVFARKFLFHLGQLFPFSGVLSLEGVLLFLPKECE